MPEESSYYVYVHRRLSDNTIFYVGKGCKDRYKAVGGRGSLWWEVVKEEGGFQPCIFEDRLTREESLLKEANLIKSLEGSGLVNVMWGTQDRSQLTIPEVIYENKNIQITFRIGKKDFSQLKRFFKVSDNPDYFIPVEEVKSFLKENNFKTSATKVAAFFGTKVKNKRVNKEIKSCLFGVEFL